MNYVLAEIIDYFVIYFGKINERVIKRTSKVSVDAYVRSL